MRFMALTAIILTFAALACSFEVKGIPEQIELTGCPPFTQASTVAEDSGSRGLDDAGTDADACVCQDGDPMCDCL